MGGSRADFQTSSRPGKHGGVEAGIPSCGDGKAAGRWVELAAQTTPLLR